MRIMFYGLQNSGATLVALFAGQRSGSLVIPDLWTMYAAPALDSDLDACIKVTATSTFPLERHVEAFRPDHMFLVVRRPVDNIISLRRKHFARHNGTPEEKFAIADAAFADATGFTGVISFEEFVTDPGGVAKQLTEVGWDVPSNAGEFSRTPLEMERHIWRSVPALYQRAQWGTGEARIQPLSSVRLGAAEDPEAARFCEKHSPNLHAHYESRVAKGDLPQTVPLKYSVQDEVAFQAQRTFVSGQVGLFESFMRLGDAEAALELATELCGLAPDDPAPWNGRARALDMLRRHDEAKEVLTKALASAEGGSPLEIGLRMGLAGHALRTGDIEGCIAAASAVVEDSPRSLPAHQSLADAALRQQRFTDVQRHALAALEVDPRSVNAMRTYAEGLFGAGDVEQACDVLRNCLAIAPDFELARRKLAQFLSHTPPGE